MRFVLVHGGWQGGWCWDGVAASLREDGHTVFAPTLRGSGTGAVDRTGLNLTAIGDDLIDQIGRAGLRDFVLVGHSGGGPVSQYAADRLPERTRRVVFVDSFVLHDGEAIHDVLPAHLAEADRAAAAQSTDRSIGMDPGRWQAYFMNGATEDQLAASVARLGRVPLGWLAEPISLPRFRVAGLPASYVFLRDSRSATASLAPEMARRLGDPRLVECDGPHEAMLTHPLALAEALSTVVKE